jgi:hypothetical protein
MSAYSEEMQNILIAATVKSPDDLPPGLRAIEYTQLAVKLAEANLHRLQAEADARDYGLHHLTEFQQKPDQQEYIARQNDFDNLRKEIFTEQDAITALHGDLYKAFVNYRTSVANHLGYLDFLYFSVGAATTATFGDISPNSTLVRMLQVLGSIVLTGLMINGLATGRGGT